MYKPASSTQVNREPQRQLPASFVAVDNGSDSEDYASAAHAGDEMQPSVDIDTQQHLTPDMFVKAQEMIMDIEVVASPAQMEQNPNLRTWQLAPHILKELKQNLATVNRDRATEDQLAGNLSRCIPLHLEVQEKMNGFPYAMGIEIPGMMNKNLHKNGACVTRVPAHVGFTALGTPQAVFEPTNIVSAYMYENYKMCTVEDLANDIKFVKGTPKTKAHAMVAVGSLAYASLKDNLENPHNWADQRHEIDEALIEAPGRNTYAVQVTEAMGKDLHNLLREPIEKAASSFINLADFNVKFVRADGNSSFTAFKGINGELMADTAVNAPTYRSELMQRACTFYIKAKLVYILF
jgi:hypothetical protein